MELGTHKMGLTSDRMEKAVYASVIVLLVTAVLGFVFGTFELPIGCFLPLSGVLMLLVAIDTRKQGSGNGVLFAFVSTVGIVLS